MSAQPSALPTHIDALMATFKVELSLIIQLNDTQVTAFETATADFIAMQAFLSDTVVTVTSQTLLSSRRELQTTSFQTADPLLTGITIGFDVDTVYTGPDKSFDLFAVLDPSFQGLESTWLELVAGSGDVFESLRPSFNPVEFPVDGRSKSGSRASGESGDSGISAAGATMVILVAVCAILMGIVASVYSVSSFHLAIRGQELASPKGAPRLSHECVPTPTGSEQDQQARAFSPSQQSVASSRSSVGGGVELTQSGNLMDSISNFSCTSDADKQTLSPVSPNAMERGQNCGADEIFKNVPFRLSGGEGGRHSQDPPSNTGFNQYRNKQSLFDNDGRSEISIDSRFMGSKADAFMSGGGSRARGQAVYPPQYPSNQAQSRGSERTYGNINDASHELMLTKSMGGTLGAAPIGGAYPESQASQSDFSSHAKSFFSGMLGGTTQRQPHQVHRVQRQGSGPTSSSNGAYSSSNASGNGNLGARSLRNDEDMKLKEKSSYDSFLRRAGLYDVFAPAGPIGIVVDTSKEGPAVHSLKSTSPMLGLINRGDLIVGLDDQDTRSMTAATLTRLMAKKSSQKERKITLLTSETYY